MRRACPVWLGGFIWCLAGSFASGLLTAAEAPPTPKQLQIQIEILQDQIKKLQTSNAELQQKATTIDPDLGEAYKQAKKKEYAYYVDLMDANLKAFYAQRIASYVILILVFIVVVSGISFAGFQLWKSISAAGVQSNSEFELSASKVRVTSSVVGIVILTISLVFLFIYAQQIYQVRVIDVSAASTGQAESK
jgi:hypothetical protein